jgi:two-component system, chemotaxis family, protein-glutamate methylesterase/glutaminase
VSIARTVRVLVVDASIVGRHVVGRALGAEPWLDVVGVTTPGPAALKRLQQLAPDVVMLGAGHPAGDAIELLREIHRLRPRLPVIMLSTADSTGSASLVEALTVGAIDLCTVPVPSGDLDASVEALRSVIVPKLRALLDVADGGRRRTPAPTDPPEGPRPFARRPASSSTGRKMVEVLVIGSSTGGPNALRHVWSMLPRDLPVPVLVVQHMPAAFTTMLAAQIDAVGTVPCREAEAGMRLRAGVALLAPGDRHLVVAASPEGPIADLDDSPRVHGCRPAVDQLFRSASAVFGSGVLAVVLTGMGVDGVAGSRAVVAAGGGVVVQDELTSVVWGMPGSVAAAGLADEVLALSDMASAIVERVAVGRSWTAPVRSSARVDDAPVAVDPWP